MSQNEKYGDFLKTLTILYVEDDDDAREQLGRFLQRRAGTLITANNGVSGLETFRRQRPAIVITDIQMPEMDGLTMAREIRELDPDVPIIVVTAFEQTGYLLRAIDIGVDKYVDKPVKTDRLHAALLECAHRLNTEMALKEKEEYLRTIMATIQTGVMVSEKDSGLIVDVNPYAARLIGLDADSLIGQHWTDYLEEALDTKKAVRSGAKEEDGRLITSLEKTLSLHLSKANVCIRDQCYTIHSFLDISDIRQLFEQQSVNIELAKGLLSLVNPILPRHIPVNDRVGLHIEAISLPCRAAGGDHFFVRRLPEVRNRSGPATYLSVKDQSGHEVNCILRSIFTDLIHNAVLQNDGDLSFEQNIHQLNDRLIRGGMFAQDDFLTAILARIDHGTLNMQFASCGHPPFLLIRKGDVVSLPRTGGLGRNLPLGTIEDIPFSSGRIRLQSGDKLLFYTDGLTEMPLEKYGWQMTHQDLELLISELVRQEKPFRVSDLMADLLASVAHQSGQRVQHPDLNTSADDITLIGLEVEDITIAQTKTLLPQTTEALCKDIRELSDAISGPWQAAGLANAGRRVRIVLEEAVLNAWKNGHHAEPGKPITVRWREGNDFHLEVIDAGNGFDPSLIADPTLPNNILEPSGRGIYIMRMTADEIHWKNGGRHLSATFFRHSSPINTTRHGQFHHMAPLWQLPNR